MSLASVRCCRWSVVFLWGLAAASAAESPQAGSTDRAPDRLPGTDLLTMEGDIASELVAGADRFLLRELEDAPRHRQDLWRVDCSSLANLATSQIQPRAELARRLGVRDPRHFETRPRLQVAVGGSSLVGRGANYEIHAIEWPAFGDVQGQGLLLEPVGRAPHAQVIAIPDCEVTPEQLVGLRPGVAAESQYARRLAAAGCRVVVPLLVNREDHLPQLSHREWLYRSAFELGRGLLAYEVQEIEAVVDWMVAERSLAGPVGLIGWGEGGLVALLTASLDPRIEAVVVSGYFDSRQELWREPIDRNVFGYLQWFGDAELAALIAPRPLIVEACRAPAKELPGGRGAPATLATPPLASVQAECARARQLVAALQPPAILELIETEEGTGPNGSTAALESLLKHLDCPGSVPLGEPPTATEDRRDLIGRHTRLIHELDRHSQQLLARSQDLRAEATMRQFDFSSLAAYERSALSVREHFYRDVIGRFERPRLEARPRSRVVQRTPAWTCYEVVLDVFPDVIAYGLLLVPNDLQPGERRPVVVCQHGLEGRPQDTIGEANSQYYAAFAARLAERGFVTFAPQNLYIFTDRFRSLQRKANPLGKTLFSLIIPQHQQIVDWLQALDFVDPQRIGFYGLSYGGKTAMRVPAIVTAYALSICSADFNEWVDKNASTLNPHSYVQSGEYEIFEFDLGSTFNYAEMAALIAPRPFMVERGHHDGVADDWTVAYEYAKVRNLYAARLKIPDRTEIEWFDGPHAIHGAGTYAFLHRHLRWPEPPQKSGQGPPEGEGARR